MADYSALVTFKAAAIIQILNPYPYECDKMRHNLFKLFNYLYSRAPL